MPITDSCRTAALLLGSLALCACAALPPNTPRVPQDPWESWNRSVYGFNDRLDRTVAKPIARGYVKIFPEPVRVGVSNFFRNLDTPTVMVNDALQGKAWAAVNDLGRFVFNSTVGIGGILDPATAVGLPLNNEDFGQTLGKWGVSAGPFLEVPLLGPSDARDFPARFVDAYTNPRQYIRNDWIRYGLLVPDFVDRRAALLPLDGTLSGVYDPYAFIRDAYLQHRQYLVTDGKEDTAALADPEADAR